MNTQPQRSDWWTRLTPTDWALIGGLVLLTLSGIVFAVYFVSRVDPVPPPPIAASVRENQSTVGYMVEADDDKIVIKLGNDRERSFAVRPQDRKLLALDYLDRHEGHREVGFRIYYQTIDGRDYAIAAEEGDIPFPGSSG